MATGEKIAQALPINREYTMERIADCEKAGEIFHADLLLLMLVYEIAIAP